MVKKATSGVLVMLLLIGFFGFNWPKVQAQTATPSQAVITVSGVPTGTKGLTVEVTVDTAVITLGSASTDVSGALAASDSMSAGVGVLNFSGDLPASFTITVPLVGVAAGMSSIAVGNVLNKLGGTAIAGAMASVSLSSVTVASSSTTTSSSTSSTSSSGGAGGALSSDTISIAINGTAVNDTSALNVTISFSDSAVASLDTAGVDVMGNGITKLLTEVMGDVITGVWSGNTTDGAVTISAMLKPGSKAGSTNIGVTKVEAAGGVDITSSVAATVTPSSVTNSAAVSMTDLGTFTLIGPDSVTGPGKVAVAFSVEGAASGLSATLNGKKVDFVSTGAGVAIITVGKDDVALSLAVMAGGMSDTVDLGTLTVDAGTGKAPSISSASANNKSSGTSLVVTGKKLSKTDTTIEIVPTDRSPSSGPTVKGANLKASFDASDCIPKGSYINVSTPGGVSGKKIKTHGSCSNSLVE